MGEGVYAGSATGSIFGGSVTARDKGGVHGSASSLSKKQFGLEPIRGSIG